MNVGKVNSYESQTKRNLKTAIGAGALVTGLQAITLPREAKYYLRSAIIGSEKFVKQSKDAALETIRNCESEGLKNFASNINVEQVGENAKQMVLAGKSIFKALGKTFVGMTAGVLIGSLISDAIFAHKEKK